MIYNASDLFTLRDVGHPHGKPEWANVRAYRLSRWRGTPPELTGPGIYGLCLDDSLFYIGLFAGASQDPFGGSVLSRWFKHITYQSLRSPHIRFARQELKDILRDIEGPVSTDFRRCLPSNGNTDWETIDSNEYPLVADRNGASCTFNKARFAAKNWGLLGPGNETGLLQRITCIYHRIPRDTDALMRLNGSIDKERRNWVKFKWLKPREAMLIEALRPICNHEIKAGSERRVSIEEADTAIANALSGPFPSFASNIQSMTGQFGPIEPQDTQPPPQVVDSPDNELDLLEDETSVDEARLRSRLSTEGEALVDELQETCPSGFNAYFTNTPDLRIALKHPSERVLLTLSSRYGSLRCRTRASVAACRAIGFDAKPAGGGGMSAEFLFEPMAHELSALFAVAGAAAASTV